MTEPDQFLSTIWINVDGMEVMRLPLSMGPALTWYAMPEIESPIIEYSEPDQRTCDCICSSCSGCIYLIYP